MKIPGVLFATFSLFCVAAPSRLSAQTIDLYGPGSVVPCGAFGQACTAHFARFNDNCARTQSLVPVAELAGLQPGTSINSVALYVTDSFGHVWPDLQLAVGHSASSNFANFNCSNFGYCADPWLPTTVVRGPAAWTDVPGWNTFVFDTPFVWNGIDGLVFDFRFSDPTAVGTVPGGLGMLATTDFATMLSLGGEFTTFVANSGIACPLTNPTFIAQGRLVLRVGYCSSATAVATSAGCSSAGPAPTLTGTPPFVGQTGTLNVTGAAPSAWGVLMLGQEYGPAAPLPSGCLYYLKDDFFFQFFFTDAAGAWSYAALIPNAPGVQADLQAIVLPAGGFPNLQTTNSLRLTIGC